MMHGGASLMSQSDVIIREVRARRVNMGAASAVGAAIPLGNAEKVPLAELDAAMAQDVVGGGGVEIEVGEDEARQVVAAGELKLGAAGFECDRAVDAGVDGARIDAFDEIDGLGDTRYEVGEARLGIGIKRHLET